MLEKVKLLLGDKIDWTDERIQLLIDDMTQVVLDYCKLNELPSGLEIIVRQMVVEQIEKTESDNVASIKRGDTQISYLSTNVGTFTKKQKDALNRYRQISKR